MVQVNGPGVRAATPILAKRRREFAKLVKMAQRRRDREHIDLAATLLELAAFHATWRHHGDFADTDLDRAIWTIARSLDSPSVGIPRGDRVERVLHVTSMVGGLAGLQHLLVRWIEADGGRRHDIAVTQP